MVSVAGESWFEAPDLQKIMTLLNADGAEARVAGGAVRNSLMGLATTDVDIATDLRPEAVMERARAFGIKAVPTGIDHGTVTLVVDGRPFEVTTLRRDISTNGRHAEVAFGTDWQEDANRRDLTINALYADKNGDVIDLIGGLADIETRTVRFIGKAEDRIAEDYLRILRYFRFFACYGAGRPDADALRSMARLKDGLKHLSAERIWSELKKLLSADDPGRALLWMRTTGILTLILPETEKWGIDEVPGVIETARVLKWPVDPLLRLAAMVPPDGERLKTMAERLRLSRQEAAFLADWAAAPKVPGKIASTAFARMLYRSGKDGLVTQLKLSLATARTKAASDPQQMTEVARLQGLLTQAQAWEKPQFAVSGSDVLALGVAAGPHVGKMLKLLEDEWVDGNFNADRQTLLKRLAVLVEQSAPAS
jgi:poly(A) polymerase